MSFFGRIPVFALFNKYKIRQLIHECAEDVTVQARTHQAQGRYKDAEYLYRQLEAASAPPKSSHDSLLKSETDMVLIYENLGNLPAAETLQQDRLAFLMRHELASEDSLLREAENLFRLYTLFLARVEEQNYMTTNMVLMAIFYRIAILGCSLLNALLFKSELWPRYDHELCLHVAIRIHSTEMIRGLISIGVDVNKSGASLDLPLLSAVLYGDLDGLELLLDKNVDVGAQEPNSNRTALHDAMWRDPEQKVEIIYRLIKAGVDVNAIDSRGHTALHSAVFHGPEPDEKTVHCLIEAGLNVEVEDWNKETVLCLAVRRGYLATVQLLLQQGANTEVYGHVDETPLFGAVRYADESMTKLLLDHGANAEAQARTGNTPLHLAVNAGKRGLVEVLLNGGASSAACNNSGQTPVDMAKWNVEVGNKYSQTVLDTLLRALKTTTTHVCSVGSLLGQIDTRGL